MNQKPTALLTISLPRAMAAQVEKQRKAEHRTRSELVREALRTYFAMSQLPIETPTPAERRIIERGRREFRRGQYTLLTRVLKELGRVDDLERRPHKVRSQRA